MSDMGFVLEVNRARAVNEKPIGMNILCYIHTIP